MSRVVSYTGLYSALILAWGLALVSLSSGPVLGHLAECSITTTEINL